MNVIRFYSKELDVNYKIVLEENSLMLFINGDKKSTLNSVKENLFSNDNYGTFEFIENSNDSFTGFKLASGRVKNLKFSKEQRIK